MATSDHPWVLTQMPYVGEAVPSRAGHEPLHQDAHVDAHGKFGVMVVPSNHLSISCHCVP